MLRLRCGLLACGDELLKRIVNKLDTVSLLNLYATNQRTLQARLMRPGVCTTICIAPSDNGNLASSQQLLNATRIAMTIAIHMLLRDHHSSSSLQPNASWTPTMASALEHCVQTVRDAWLPLVGDAYRLLYCERPLGNTRWRTAIALRPVTSRSRLHPLLLAILDQLDTFDVDWTPWDVRQPDTLAQLTGNPCLHLTPVSSRAATDVDEAVDTTTTHKRHYIISTHQWNGILRCMSFYRPYDALTTAQASPNTTADANTTAHFHALHADAHHWLKRVAQQIFQLNTSPPQQQNEVTPPTADVRQARLAHLVDDGRMPIGAQNCSPAVTLSNTSRLRQIILRPAYITAMNTPKDNTSSVVHRASVHGDDDDNRDFCLYENTFPTMNEKRFRSDIKTICHHHYTVQAARILAANLINDVGRGLRDMMLQEHLLIRPVAVVQQQQTSPLLFRRSPPANDFTRERRLSRLAYPLPLLHHHHHHHHQYLPRFAHLTRLHMTTRAFYQQFVIGDLRMYQASSSSSSTTNPPAVATHPLMSSSSLIDLLDTTTTTTTTANEDSDTSYDMCLATADAYETHLSMQWATVRNVLHQRLATLLALTRHTPTIRDSDEWRAELAALRRVWSYFIRSFHDSTDGVSKPAADSEGRASLFDRLYGYRNDEGDDNDDSYATNTSSNLLGVNLAALFPCLEVLEVADPTDDAPYGAGTLGIGVLWGTLCHSQIRQWSPPHSCRDPLSPQEAWQPRAHATVIDTTATISSLPSAAGESNSSTPFGLPPKLTRLVLSNVGVTDGWLETARWLHPQLHDVRVHHVTITHEATLSERSFRTRALYKLWHSHLLRAACELKCRVVTNDDAPDIPVKDLHLHPDFDAWCEFLANETSPMMIHTSTDNTRLHLNNLAYLWRWRSSSPNGDDKNVSSRAYEHPPPAKRQRRQPSSLNEYTADTQCQTITVSPDCNRQLYRFSREELRDDDIVRRHTATRTSCEHARWLRARLDGKDGEETCPFNASSVAATLLQADLDRYRVLHLMILQTIDQQTVKATLWASSATKPMPPNDAVNGGGGGGGAATTAAREAAWFVCVRTWSMWHAPLVGINASSTPPTTASLPISDSLTDTTIALITPRYNTAPQRIRLAVHSAWHDVWRYALVMAPETTPSGAQHTGVRHLSIRHLRLSNAIVQYYQCSGVTDVDDDNITNDPLRYTHNQGQGGGGGHLHPSYLNLFERLFCAPIDPWLAALPDTLESLTLTLDGDGPCCPTEFHARRYDHHEYAPLADHTTTTTPSTFWTLHRLTALARFTHLKHFHAAVSCRDVAHLAIQQGSFGQAFSAQDKPVCITCGLYTKHDSQDDDDDDDDEAYEEGEEYEEDDDASFVDNDDAHDEIDSPDDYISSSSESETTALHTLMRFNDDAVSNWYRTRMTNHQHTRQLNLSRLFNPYITPPIWKTAINALISSGYVGSSSNNSSISSTSSSSCCNGQCAASVLVAFLQAFAPPLSNHSSASGNGVMTVIATHVAQDLTRMLRIQYEPDSLERLLRVLPRTLVTFAIDARRNLSSPIADAHVSATTPIATQDQVESKTSDAPPHLMPSHHAPCLGQLVDVLLNKPYRNVATQISFCYSTPHFL